MIQSIPNNWTICTFDDILEIVSGRNQKQVENPNGQFPIYGSGGIMGRADNYLCLERTTIIGRKGTINSPIYVNEKFWNVDTAFGLSPKYVESKLLYYFCLVFNFKDLDKSTTIPSLAKTDLLQIEFPLPPLAEQHRIVEKIEELFSELDKGIETLKTAQQQLKVYRQAVLKYAFEGKLTNPEVKEGELPEGWVRIALRNLTVKAEKVKLKDKDPDEEFLYLDIGAIDNQRNKFTGYKTYRWKEAPSRAQQIVHHKDVLFSTVRTYLKNIAQVSDMKFQGQICSSGFTIIRANTQTDSAYLFKYVLYEGFLAPLNELQTGTSYPAVRDEDVLSQEVCIPINKEMQVKVSDEIESRLSICDKIEEAIQQGLQQAEALRQSILKKAFEGKLVPQDPNDEPASVLLDRIKAARAGQTATKKSRIKKVTLENEH